jgi:hypothetical protein
MIEVKDITIHEDAPSIAEKWAIEVRLVYSDSKWDKIFMMSSNSLEQLALLTGNEITEILC